MTKLLAAPTRYFKVAIFACLIITGMSNAQQSPLTKEDMEFVNKSKRIIENAQASKVPEWLRTDNEKFASAHNEALELVKQLQQTDPTMKQMDELSKAKRRFSNQKIVVFASRSLGEQSLKDILGMASQNQDVVVAFRGIPQEANLGEAMLEIQNVASGYSPMPNIVINPVLFTEYNVTSVPTIIARKEQSVIAGQLPEEVARVLGLSNPNWLMNKINSGETGNLGIRGPIESISEPDLIELMKDRYAKIDWEEKKQNAVNNFWKKQTFRELPEAHNDRIRELDPTVYISKDITTPDGTLIARKGDLINPLNLTPFTQAIVVLDPLDKDQVKRVKEALPRINKIPGVKRITYIVTRLDKETGWDSYTKTTDTFDAPVFLLTPDVAQRFELEYVPSIITAQGKLFKIEELADKRGEP
ncbi:TrbC family F-type conjugative pilus assembly protein [Pseudoalteromonas sp. TAB23]|uniref:TrbC family F-type conjugative pilus assembly protein n=1 Tax=Pseudoalteromonas sp. TAB23 TaxID=1938595 RepID=UPI0003FFB76B|nr:TrbC family F-type conjugative pilus assembly protein [Pseudoalteromonas sp. TAB23]